MKRITIAVAALLVTAVGADAQSNAQRIERALSAAPGRAAEDAMVVRWNADFSYTTIKEGSNGWVCYDRSGEAGRSPFAVQCTNVGNLERVAQNRRFEQELDRGRRQAMINEAEQNGTRVQPVYGSMFISRNGPDMASAGTHTTIAVPGATAQSTGLPSSGSYGGSYIMAEGSSSAHIMIPGR